MPKFNLINMYKLILFSILTTQIHSQTIPTEWMGKWEGTVDIWRFNEKIDSFPMSLEISPRDTAWSFIISYDKNQNKPDIRKYQLIKVNQPQGHFAIDEQNSILLDTYLVGDCMFTKFSGMGNDLQTRICLSNEQLEYEITSSHSAPVRISGNEVIGKDTIPEIRSYDVFTIMKAKLKKDK